MLKTLKVCSWVLKKTVFLLAALVTAISGYTLWYNNQVYASAKNIRSELYDLKPTVSGDAVLGFDELRKINPDVVAWLTVPGTHIDDPVVQGETNMTYMNMDIYGQFSLAGSIFLDSRNDPQFHDRYSIIYGHHMENHEMFGDLDLFKDEAFFNANRTATILTDEGETEYEVLGYGELNDSVQEIFDPLLWKDSLAGIEAPIQAHTIHVSQSILDKLIAHPNRFNIVVLVTCASGSTGTRTIVILISQRPEDYPSLPDEPDDPNNPSSASDPSDPSSQPPNTGMDLWDSPVILAGIMAVCTAVLALLCFMEHKKPERRSKNGHDI